jgi:hypothetical protein
MTRLRNLRCDHPGYGAGVFKYSGKGIGVYLRFSLVVLDKFGRNTETVPQRIVGSAVKSDLQSPMIGRRLRHEF